MDNIEVKQEMEGSVRLNKSVIWLLMSILCIVISLGINYYTSGRAVTIKFVTTGEKNEVSLGNNIRISKIVSDKDSEFEDVYGFEELQISGNWEIDGKNNLLTCYNVSQNSEAVIQVRDAKNINIDFVSEIGSGIVEVYIDDNLAERIDLYSDSKWSSLERNYELKYPKTFAFAVAWIVLFILGLICLLIFMKNNYGYVKIKIQNLSIIKLNMVCIKRAVYTGIFAVVVYIVIFTVFQNLVYKNIYDEKAVLTITATGEKGSRALANNVRITGITINGDGYDFSDIELKDGWEYSSVDHMLYVYNIKEPASFDIELNDVRTIDISYVEEVGSGIFEISIDNKVVNNVNAYKNCKWDDNTVTYKISPLMHPYSSYITLTILFIFFFVLSCIFSYKGEKLDNVFNYIRFIVINIIFSIILYLFISFIQRESIIDTITWAINCEQNFIEGLCIVILLNILLAMILKKNYRSFIVLSVLFMILLTVNYFKLQFRDNPLFPWDFLLMSVAASVVNRFKLIPSIPFSIAVIVFISVIIILHFVTKKRVVYKMNVITRSVTAVITCVLLVTYFSTYLFTTGVNLFTAKEYYIEKGFVAAFAESAKYLKPIDRPENYSEENMQAIYNKINDLPEQSYSNRANIIVLMSESFWDITRVKELGFSKEIFPTYRELQKTSITGELLTNVYNGGTVNSEFEALTGFSVAYLPNEYMPYQRCMRPDFFSINSYLKSEGYESLAIHPFEKTNYNRNTAYEYMNIDKTLWEEDFDKNTERMRGYISDHALTERIISEYEKHNAESDTPWFNLSVSMQNHGGYWESSIDGDKNYNIDVSNFKGNSKGSIKDLAIGLHYADLALGELIDYFEKVDEPTIIIMFGDHMSNAGPIGETLLDQSDLLKGNVDLSVDGKSVSTQDEQSVLEQRRVPFMAWSNYGNVQKDCGMISVTQLLPTVFSEYNVTMPKYFEYLKKSQEIYPACASNIILDKDGKVSFINNMTDEQKKQYDEYWLIEYDYIFGKNYLKDLFEY